MVTTSCDVVQCVLKDSGLKWRATKTLTRLTSESQIGPILFVIFDRFQPILVKMAKIDSKSAPPKGGVLNASGRAGEGVCGWKSDHKTGKDRNDHGGCVQARNHSATED